MFTRREMLRTAAQMGAYVTLPARVAFTNATENAGVEVNDQQSRLNATRVHRIVQPRRVDDIGTIPIFFHWVLAGYLFTLGQFYRKASPKRD